MLDIFCSNCHCPYPETENPFRCPNCGGFYDYSPFPNFDPKEIENDEPGIWRYRNAFGLPDDAPTVTLGEGQSALIWAEVFGKQVAFKQEYLNPSGSFKDRGTAVLMSFLKSRGVESAIEDSSGNAGASFAAYAARAGIGAKVFIPDSASGPKRQQIISYGAELVRTMGPRSNAAKAVLQAAENGETYASHSYMPFGLAGYATLAYELFQELGEAPGCVIMPAGQANLWLATGRGFEGMLKAGLIKRMPVMVGVQAMACAPLFSIHTFGPVALNWVIEADTLAEGVRVRMPLRGDAVLQFARKYAGFFVAVDEPDILPGLSSLSHLGLYVEPTSAIVWKALAEVINFVPEPVVVVLTGSGLKYAGS